MMIDYYSGQEKGSLLERVLVPTPLGIIYRTFLSGYDSSYFLRISTELERNLAAWSGGQSYQVVRKEFERSQHWLEASSPWRKSGYFLSRLMLKTEANAVNRFCCWIAQQRLLQTAIALERHRVAQGKYPPTLTALVPTFLSTVPLDPMDHQPLRYRLEADGRYILYSIGVDGKDDGGNSEFTDLNDPRKNWRPERTHDVVWPRVAAEALPRKKEEGRKKNRI
jgi:hypothetical protein